jgi:hypothetical protein
MNMIEEELDVVKEFIPVLSPQEKNVVDNLRIITC